MSTKVLKGDIRNGMVVIRTERGRAGESRTVVVMGHMTEPGVVQASETRSLATVQAWAREGRMRISARDAGGYYVAQWKGVVAPLRPR